MPGIITHQTSDVEQLGLTRVVAARKPFLLRIDAQVLGDLQRWADDELRSLNGQIEFVLRQALERAGRQRSPARPRNQDRPGDEDG